MARSTPSSTTQQLLLDSASDGLVVIDTLGSVIHFNSAAERLLGRNPLHTRPEDWPKEYGFSRPECGSDFPSEHLPPVHAIRGEYPREVEVMVTRPGSGEPHLLKMAARPFFDPAGEVEGAFVILRSHAPDQKRGLPSSLIDRMVERVAHGVIVFREDGSLVYANEAAARTLGYSERELLDRSFPQLDRSANGTSWKGYWADIKRERQRLTQATCEAKSGAAIPIEAALTHFDVGELEFVSVVFREIAAGAAVTGLAESEASENALRDPLTRLPSAALFLDQLKRSLDRSRRRQNYGLGVLVLDVDRFRSINETHGRAVGDLLLARLGARLERSVRPCDTVARLAGGTFAVLLDDIADVSEASRTAVYLQGQIDRPFNISGTEITTTVSVGIAFSSLEYECAEDHMRDAEEAMRRAKEQGEGRRQVSNIDVDLAVRARMDLEAELVYAIKARQLVLHYQPIIELSSGRLYGFEALVRWNHPRHGFIPPQEFIPLSEETDLVIPIDRYVLSEACNQFRRWESELGEAPALSMSVNFSGKQFSDPDLVGEVEKILGETNFDPRRLKVEITEGEIMNNPDAAAALLERLKMLGIELSVDDFGTGYSSLSYLHSLPVDNLKIDRSFVSRMSGRNKNYEIVKTIITLSHNLGLAVIAEGIESEQQHTILKILGCAFGQGTFFSPPLPPEDATALVIENCTMTTTG